MPPLPDASGSWVDRARHKHVVIRYTAKIYVCEQGNCEGQNDYVVALLGPQGLRLELAEPLLFFLFAWGGS